MNFHRITRPGLHKRSIEPVSQVQIGNLGFRRTRLTCRSRGRNAGLGTSVKLLTSLRNVVLRHGRELPASTRPDPVAFAQLITGCTDKLAIYESYWLQAQLVSADKTVHRYTQGRIPEELIPEREQIASLFRAITSVVSGIAAALTEADESLSPSEREEQSRAGVELGVYFSGLETLDKLFSAWATHDKVPWAKWLEWVEDVVGITSDAWLCASPMTAAQVLSGNLWKNVSAAVCTSANDALWASDSGRVTAVSGAAAGGCGLKVCLQVARSTARRRRERWLHAERSD